jgi:hypothetical protein
MTVGPIQERMERTHNYPKRYAKMKVWIGLVGVGCLPGCDPFQGKAGAYVNALAWVSSAADFEAAVRRDLEVLGLFPFEFEDIEPFDSRVQTASPEQELRDLAEDVRRLKETRFGTFHSYKDTDA